MNGTELATRYYNEYKSALFSGELAVYENTAAVGFTGQGSECFGFDDEISKDHDFEPGFKVFLSRGDYEKAGVALTRAYNALPKEFLGCKRLSSSIGGSGRYGVFCTPSYYNSVIGSPGVPAGLKDWLHTPEYALATAVNGVMFSDGNGEFSSIRNTLLKGYPRDVMLKKLASRLISMAQSGQYNFPRCISRGDFAAASLALNEFVKSAASAVYLLNNSYMPYYKWIFRGMERFTDFRNIKDSLEYLLTDENAQNTSGVKTVVIEDICADFIKELKDRHLAELNYDYLEPFAYALNDLIENREIKSMHIMTE